ncbi:MAG: DMT family transporter [Proteobacteria bacterium]|nr:DMT family transporter [Pseudomonadota bacterium]
MPAAFTLRARLAAIPAPLRAGGCMLVFALFASLSNGICRYLGRSYPAMEITFFFTLFTLVAVVPTLLGSGLAGVRTTRHGLFLARSAVTAFHTFCMVYGLTLLPVDKATALNFTVPIFTTIGAALVFGEHVGLRRWSAVAAGVLGSLIILRPGFGAYEPGSIFPVLAAAGMAAVLLIIKALARTEPPQRVVFYLALYTTPMTLPPALLVWVTPTPELLFWTLLIGIMVGISHNLVVRAFALMEASFVAMFDFLRLPFGAIVGLLAFGELMDGLSWLGAAVILGASLYIARREAVLRRPRPPAAAIC